MNYEINCKTFKMTGKISTILLTGSSGVGKTTAVKKVIKIMKQKQLTVAGFWTDEIRYEDGGQIGFDVVAVDGKRAILARKIAPGDDGSHPRFGKFCVYVSDFNKIALPPLKVTANTLLILDEIGRMQLSSEAFTKGLEEITGKTTILATISNIKFGKKMEALERLMADNKSLTLPMTKKNRNLMVEVILERVERIFREKKEGCRLN